MIIKHPTTPQAHRYSTLWNVNIRKSSIVGNQVHCLTINVDTLYYVMINLYHSDYSDCPPVARMQDLVNNTVMHSSSHINQTLYQVIYILQFCVLDCLSNYAKDFVVNWIEFRAVRRPQIWKFIRMTILDYCTFGVEAAKDAQNVRRDQRPAE